MKPILIVAVALTPLLAFASEPQGLNAATTVLSEIMASPEKGIPQNFFEHAHCIVIVPDLKAGASNAGGTSGKGYLSCRNVVGAGWSAPAAVRIEGGGFAFQDGGSSTDLILLAMNARGADKLLSDKFTLGSEGSVTAGPVGHLSTAQTNPQMHADILSWSRSQGLFTGLVLEGATVRQDLDGNAAIYGKRLDNRDIVTKRRRMPAAAVKLSELLNNYSEREETSASVQ